MVLVRKQVTIRARLQVMSWETLEQQRAGADKAPKLLRFMGRPHELSPLVRHMNSAIYLHLSK